MVWIVLAVLFAAGFLLLVLAIMPDSIELREVRSLADALPRGELNQIFALIEAIGTSPGKGYLGILCDALEPNGTLRLALPDALADFPWSGMAAEIIAADRKARAPVEFKVYNRPADTKSVDEQQIRWLAVPFVTAGRKKRGQSVFSYERYIRLSPALARRLSDLYPKNPKALLAQLLSTDGRSNSSEPFNQIRCGVSAGWIQTPTFHKCPTCRRPMRLILQVPGALLATRLAEGTFYHFGCPSHPDQTVTDDDWG